MAELIVETGPRAGTRVVLSRETSCTIGSAAGSTLRLESPGVEREHAVIKALKDEGFGIKALAGDTRVDGEQVTATRLPATARIEVAGIRLRYSFSQKSAAQRPSHEPERAQPVDVGRAVPASTGLTQAGAKDAGTTLGGFRLIEVLGKGGWGTVYRAEQVSLHRELAVKVLNKELTKDPVFVARFVAEARAAARLSHPNVVQVFDVGHVDDTYFYSMEIMQAGSLELRLKAAGAIPVDEALAMLVDAARGLAFAESMRIVHRDIKPDNLMIDQHGTVKIVDLGLAMSDEDEQTKIAGTPHFMSPEQVQKKPLDHRSDLYSLGCTFYRLMTGKTPFSGASSKEILKAQLTDKHEPAGKVKPEIPAEVSAILDKLLQKDPAQRYQSANELIADVENVIAPPAKKGLLVAGIAVAVLVAGGAVWYGVTRKSETKVVEKTIKEKDLEGEKAKRELAAEHARDAVRDKGLGGLELAAALEAMAKDHPDTEAAGKALAESKRVREDVATKAQQTEARKLRIDQALSEVEQAIRTARASGDFPAAVKVLQLHQVAEDLRAAPELKALVERESKALQEAAQERMTQLKATIEDAKARKDPAAWRTALESIEKALDKKTGWPNQLLADHGAVAAYAQASKKELVALEAATADLATKADWKRYADAVAGPGGALDAAGRLDLAGAKALLDKAGESLAGKAPAPRLEQLGQAYAAASRFLARWQTALAAGTVTIAVEGSDAPGTVVGFTVDGEKPGALVSVGTKAKPKQVTVPREQFRDLRLAELFTIGGDQQDPRDRLALLALLALGDHVRAGRAYLGSVKADDDASGTGALGYPLSTLLLVELRKALAEAPQEPWVAALVEELESAAMLAQGLRAFSERRNLGAASYLERLATKKKESLVALALQ